MVTEMSWWPDMAVSAPQPAIQERAEIDSRALQKAFMAALHGKGQVQRRNDTKRELSWPIFVDDPPAN
jgi:hypothetical protein